MKALSAAIIVLAGATLIAAGVVVESDKAAAALRIGYLVGFIGLVVWGLQLFPGTSTGPPPADS
jgi:hypothetical protein